MRRSARFLALLLVGLALLAVAGYAVLARTTRAWFEDDLALRSRLAVASARESLSGNWSLGRARLGATLTDITRDERIMGAAACSLDGEQLAATDGIPGRVLLPRGAGAHARRGGRRRDLVVDDARAAHRAGAPRASTCWKRRASRSARSCWCTT